MADSAFDELFQAMLEGQEWEQVGAKDNRESVRELLGRVYEERYGKLQAKHFPTRVNLQKDEAKSSYAGWTTDRQRSSGEYEGMSFVWFPGEGRESLAGLVIGTAGFGEDASILSAPGHLRRLRALAREHQGRVWVKHDPLDLTNTPPARVQDTWPKAPSAYKRYGKVIYAAVAVSSDDDKQAVQDLLDLFFYEHGKEPTGSAKKDWQGRLQAILDHVFERVDADQVASLLERRRFVILEGPPGTGKTHLATEVLAKERFPSSTVVQFHPARTYEDFVVGLAPKPTDDGLTFEVRAGDLIRANARAAKGKHLLVVDEINRADLGRVLGEAILLFEVGAQDRVVELPHAVEGPDGEVRRKFSLSPNLFVVGTRNTADRSVARLDLAIRRRFSFVPVWPDLRLVRERECLLATECFEDCLQTFADYADDESLNLVPGHSYFLDPNHPHDPEGAEDRVAERMRYELLPLLHDYVAERLCGAATSHVAALADRIETKLLARSQ